MESSDTGKTLAGVEQTLSEQQEQLDTQARQMAAKQARLSQLRQQAGDRQRAGKLAQLRERTVNMLQTQQTDLCKCNAYFLLLLSSVPKMVWLNLNVYLLCSVLFD